MALRRVLLRWVELALRTELAFSRVRRRAMLVAAATLAGSVDARARQRLRRRPVRFLLRRRPETAGAAGQFLRRSVRPQSAAIRAAPAPRVAGSGPAFCVRSCDGKYFPLTMRGNASPVQMCQAFCPGQRHQGVLRQHHRRRGLEQWRALCRQRKRLRLSQGAARRLHLQRPKPVRPRAGRSDARHLAALRRRDRHHGRPGGLYRRPRSAPTRPRNSRRSPPIPASPPMSAPGSAK